MFSQWLTGKGVQLSEQVVKDFFDIPAPQAILEREVGTNQRMLQILLQSSYSEALRHLRDGRISIGVEKLVSAIESNELNLPAHVLYCHLLGFEKKYDRALEEAWEILEKFGPREDLKHLLPESLPEQFVAFYKNVGIKCEPFELSRGEYYVTDVWCAPTGVVCEWRFRHWNPLQIERLWTPSAVIEASTWGGKPLFEAEKMSIVGLTNRYALLREKSGTDAIFRMNDGFLLPAPLYPSNLEDVFAVALDGVWKKLALRDKWKGNETSTATYKNVVLVEECYDRSTGDSIYNMHIEYGGALRVRGASEVQTGSVGVDNATTPGEVGQP